MRQVSKSDRTILELTNIEARSKQYLVNQLYEQVGLTSEQAEQNIHELVNANWITESNGTYKSNYDSPMYLYPTAIDELLSNKAAIHRVIKLANQAYYPNLTFDEFVSKHRPGVERSILKKILVAAYNREFLKGLPSDLRTAEVTLSTKNEISPANNIEKPNKRDSAPWPERRFIGLKLETWIFILLGIGAIAATAYFAG